MFYLPPVEYFVKLNIYRANILIEKEEHFPKQTYRNRANVYTPDGVLGLTVPVIKGSKNHTKVKDIKISYDFNWQRLFPMLVTSASLSGAILFVTGAATAMAWAITQSGFSQTLADAVATLPGGVFSFMAISILLFALGGVMAAKLGFRIEGVADPFGPSNPLRTTSVASPGAWFANYGLHPWMLIAPVLGFGGALLAFLEKVPCRSGAWNSYAKQFQDACYTDIYPLYYNEGLAAGKVPYIGHHVEYPVLIGAAMQAVAWLVQPIADPYIRGREFFDVTVILLAICAVAGVVATARAAGPGRRWSPCTA